MRRALALVAGLLICALVAAGVTLLVLRLQSRTNPQQVNLRPGVTISENSAIVQAAAQARPAVVSVVTHETPVVRGSGYLVTTDGFIVTSVAVIAGATSMTVLLAGDTESHPARLVDYDCQTGVAVIKIDKVSGLPTLAFADPTALVQGQVVVAVGGPYEGGEVTPAYVSAIHRVVSEPDPVDGTRTAVFNDAILINAPVDAGTMGGPMLNVEAQVVGIAMQSPTSSTGGFGLNVADIQDDVQQILQSGQVVVPTLGATASLVTAEQSALTGTPEGAQLMTVDKTGPASASGLLPGDVVTQIDDARVDEAHPLELLLRSRFHPNQPVTVTYWRAGSSTQAELKLTGQHPTCA